MTTANRTRLTRALTGVALAIWVLSALVLADAFTTKFLWQWIVEDAAMSSALASEAVRQSATVQDLTAAAMQEIDAAESATAHFALWWAIIVVSGVWCFLGTVIGGLMFLARRQSDAAEGDAMTLNEITTMKEGTL